MGIELGVNTLVMMDRANVLIAKANFGPDAGLWTIPGGLVNQGESIRQASVRTIQETTGLDINAQSSLFFCEVVKPDDHRISIFCLATPLSTEIKAGSQYAEVRWIDVRELGQLQKTEGMSDFSADALVKFGDFLKVQASRPDQRASSTTVN